jgi:DNA helicase-2/ATP-dependent DNA helicase PcrA
MNCPYSTGVNITDFVNTMVTDNQDGKMQGDRPLNLLGKVNNINNVALDEILATLRPGQQQMADWLAGPLAVSAVPGAGKSTGMAVAAAIAVARNNLNHQRQLIVVTFTRTVAANIKGKIREVLQKLGLPPIGYEVYTLHGLALSIALQHRELSGLDLANSTLILPTSSHRINRLCVEKWISEHPAEYEKLIIGQQFDGEATERLRRQSVLRTEILPELTWKGIQQAKSSGISPAEIREFARLYPPVHNQYNLLNMIASLYENYQLLLKQYNHLDYDEMILAALRVLQDETVRKFWQNQVFAVFEDEAQDSTLLQAELLKILAETSDGLNLMRVGDPNQAINSTFTPADPIHFATFCQRCESMNLLAKMDQSGRSTQIIMEAANYLIHWANHSHLIPADRERPFILQDISPVKKIPIPPDPNLNPPPTGLGLELYQPPNIFASIELIGKRIMQLQQANQNLPEAEQRNFAILVRKNEQGHFLAEVFANPDKYKKYGITVNLEKIGLRIKDVSQSARYSRIPAEILALLQFIERPHSPDYLKAALAILGDRRVIPRLDYNAIASQPENFLYPDPLAITADANVQKCRQICQAILAAKLELPAYQLIAFLALTLQYTQDDLATVDKLSERVASQSVGNYSLTKVLEILTTIVGTENFETVETNPNTEQIYLAKNQLTIITMHKAKGLDWDYVFIPFLQEKNIPGDLWINASQEFIGNFDLAEMGRSQIRNVAQKRPIVDMNEAWRQAKYLKMAEELRLFYVAMTRAKRLLWIGAELQSPFMWHKPEKLQELPISPVFLALKQKFPQHFIR